MRKIIMLILAFTLVGLGYSGIYAADRSDVHWRTEGPLALWLDKPVFNQQGVDLGDIVRFDSELGEEVNFAVLYNPETGENYAIPITALSYDEEGQYLVMDVSREELASAPVFDEGKVYSDEEIDRIYSYYGEDVSGRELAMREEGYYEKEPAERRAMVGERSYYESEPGEGFGMTRAPQEPELAGRSMQMDVGEWIGKEVINSNGEHLGVVTDFILDDQENIIFAMVDNPQFDRRVAVPYSAMNFHEGREYVLLDISENRFASAPHFSSWDELMDRSYIEENYRYFGERPYWTESGAGAAMEREPGAEREFGMRRAPQEPEPRLHGWDSGFEGMKRAPQEPELEDY